MNTKQKEPMILWIWGILALALAGLVIGTFADLAIDQTLYDPSSMWAAFFAAFGPLPMFWAMSAAGFLLVEFSAHKKKWVKILYLVCAFACFLTGVVYTDKQILEVMNIDYLLGTVLSMPACWIPGWFFWHSIRNVSDLDKKKILIILLIVSLGSFVVVQVSKRLWLRPRYISIVDYGTPFVPWYLPHSGAASEFASLYASDHDWFYSFPSGHAASAACILTWLLIPAVNKKWKFSWTGIACLAWMLLTIISRMVLGKHFLSDVSMGTIISTVLMLLCVLYVWYKTPKFLENKA